MLHFYCINITTGFKQERLIKIWHRNESKSEIMRVEPQAPCFIKRVLSRKIPQSHCITFCKPRQLRHRLVFFLIFDTFVMNDHEYLFHFCFLFVMFTVTERWGRTWQRREACPPLQTKEEEMVKMIVLCEIWCFLLKSTYILCFIEKP